MNPELQRTETHALTNGDVLEFGNLHENKEKLILPWLLETKRAMDAAESFEQSVAPEKPITPSPEQEVGFYGINLNEWRRDKMSGSEDSYQQAA